MSKSKKNRSAKQETPRLPSEEDRSPESTVARGDAKKEKHGDGLRETIESIAVAFILAFLFRAFEAEAFVIPTGSMAPTLYGRHKDVDCEECGFHYTVGASDEVEANRLVARVTIAQCPNCRFPNRVKDLPVFKGDRILVNKFPFELADPQRWDVTVFKYPEEPKTNYIKRLVGLPGETIMIKRGDLYRIDDSGERRILRKQDPDKQRKLQLIVYDDDHPPRKLLEQGWPERWAPVTQSEETEHGADAIAGWSQTPDGWNRVDGRRAFELPLDRTAEGEHAWIRYRHLVPEFDDWMSMAQGVLPAARPRLITDYYGYNSYMLLEKLPPPREDVIRDRTGDNYYWVGDLTLTAQVAIEEVAEGGELLFELNEGSRCYRCRIRPADGRAELASVVNFSRDGDEEILAEAMTPLQGSGTYEVAFANVDDRLSLWIDGELVDFGEAASYLVPETLNPSPQPEDLIPAGIAARGLAATVSQLLLERDIYYRSEHLVRTEGGEEFVLQPECSTEIALQAALSDPQAWYAQYRECSREAVFELGPDEFLLLGDNSPRSQDSRLWQNTREAVHRHAVHRTALIGKAFFIYWPHGVPFLNDGKGYPVTYHTSIRPSDDRRDPYPSLRLPFYPNIGRMRRIY